MDLNDLEYLGGLVSGELTAEQRARLRRSAARKTLVGRRNTVVGMRWESPWWIGEVDVPFRPHGLLVTDAPPGGLVAEWRVGIHRDIPHGPYPVALATFELLARLDHDRQQPSFTTCNAGERICIRTITADGQPLGPPLALTVWGIFAEYI